MDFNHLRDGSVITASNESSCTIWLNSSFWVTYDEDIHLVTSGKVYLHDELKRELDFRKDEEKRMEHSWFKSENQFPTNIVKFPCQELPNSWSCEEKATKCKRILSAMIGHTIIYEHVRNPSHDHSLINARYQSLSNLFNYWFNKICMTSRKFFIYFVEDKPVCVGNDTFFDRGVDFCRTYFKCVDKALDALTKYTKESEKCETRYSTNENASSSMILRYGFRVHHGRKFEMVRTKLAYSEPGVPYHFMLQCAWRRKLIHLSSAEKDPMFKTNVIFCQRRIKDVIKSYLTFPTCDKFVDECRKIFECLSKLQRCYSYHFGQEKREGFLLMKNFTRDYYEKPVRCFHWGVQLIMADDYRMYCTAKRHFKLKGLTFCESYEWACLKLRNCSLTRKQCTYQPYKYLNFTTKESPELGLVNFQMPGFSPRENPRGYVTKLFKCNKKLGYPRRIFLYFITSVCWETSGRCNLNMSTPEYRVINLVWDIVQKFYS